MAKVWEIEMKIFILMVIFDANVSCILDVEELRKRLAKLDITID